MDWHSWLWKTNLDQHQIHQYALTFIQNELQEEDITDFNHEFLMSVGIAPAKHRLEILRLAERDAKSRLSGLSFFVSAVKKTRRFFGRFGFRKERQSNAIVPSSRGDCRASPMIRRQTPVYAPPRRITMPEYGDDSGISPRAMVSYHDDGGCGGGGRVVNECMIEPTWSMMFRDIKPT